MLTGSNYGRRPLQRPLASNYLTKKEVKTMKYETPELTALSAVNAIQTNNLQQKNFRSGVDHFGPQYLQNEPGTGYADWE